MNPTSQVERRETPCPRAAMPALGPELRAQIEAELTKYPVKQAATLPACT